MGNYIKNSVTTNETVVFESKQHWIALLPRGVVAAFFLLCGFASLDIFVPMFIFALLFILGPLIRFLTTELGFTNKRLIGKVGLIRTNSLDSPLNKINNVSCSSGLFGKIFGYGNVSITTSSGAYLYKGLMKPEQFKTNLMKQVNQFDEDRIKHQATEMANAMKGTV
ncbi:PH domain-containing protein [Enterocloster clostridioformis]|uniref:PH domain-containing protein n=1 Tax=Enterocloster clostridioformis TaxID=1531 RepID=A0A1I0J6E3_9FIRM|nr:PH domain-containing protein [Enterocloster clostridioformis]SEU05389.1 PH domain-containing protein [Enterocloster clostridioformis]SEW43523.1 PH domain-containing protein [Enterocloster clostridioformis]